MDRKEPRRSHAFTLNGYRKPGTAVEHLAARVRQYIHMPNPDALYAFVGAVAGNLLEGVPVWLMVVGPAASGKTLLVESILEMAGVGVADSITKASDFLSGTNKKERVADATGGLLRQIGNHGALVVSDFTGIMGLPRD